MQVDSLKMSNLKSKLAFMYISIFVTISLHLGLSSSDPDLDQQKLDRVHHLPGQNFEVRFNHYSGYVTVTKSSERALFYWFIEADHDHSSKPLVIWLNGGPGCSSIAYGEAEEIGPFHIMEDGKTLYLNPHSWNQVANLLFVESPVGVGFSYSNTSSDLLNNGDRRTAKDSLEFLLRWFERFPQYKGRDLYIVGESYGGHYVPQLSQAIVKYNTHSGNNAINLKGYMVGNGLTDDYHDHLGVFQFLWSTGLISDQTFRQLNILCDIESFIKPSESCDKVLDIADQELGDIDPYSIFTSSCTVMGSLSGRQLRRQSRVGRIQNKYDPCTEKHSVVYFNQPAVQKALHVNSKVAPSKWKPCSDVVYNNWKDSPKSVLDIYRELIPLGLRIWIFSGNTDGVLPVTSARYSIDALNLSTIGSWHAWYDNGQVGGWMQQYKGLTFVSVRGAGHEVPLHRPKLALALIKGFLSGNSSLLQRRELLDISDS